MTEEAWADFRQTAFGDPYLVWHDGPDFSAIREHWKTEPERVERMLLAGLGENDELAPHAIGELHDLAGDAAPRFEAALRAVTESAEFDRNVGEALDAPNFWSEHITAAMALRRATPTAELIEVLRRGVQNEEYLVRYHSANTLLAWAAGPDRDAASIETRDDLFDDLVSDSPPERWARAASVLVDEARGRLSR